jgi:hypothetical protein
VALYWTIDSRKRLVTATADGPVTGADFAAFFEAVKGARALPYRTLFDGSAAEFLMGEHEVLGVGAGFKDLQRESAGPLAVVLSDESARRLARMLGILATAERPMRLFGRRRPAERWLNSFAPAAEPS